MTDPHPTAPEFEGDSTGPGSADQVCRTGGALPARVATRGTFRPRNAMVISGIVMILVTGWVAMLLDSGSFAMTVALAASSFLVGVTIVLNQTQRWEHAEIAYEKERRNAEQWHARFGQLFSESQRTDAVVSHMTDGVVLLSPKNEILLINDAARRLLGIVDDGTYQGRPLPELIRVPQIIHAASQARSSKVDQSLAVEFVDGAVVRPISVRISCVQDDVPPHLLLVLHDETDSHRVESIRREFIANVSHELKTPLAAIKGYAETVELAIQDDPEAAMHFISQIGVQCDRLEALIADMMRLARAQSGKGRIVVQPIDWRTIIERAMQTFSPVASAKGIHLSAVKCEDAVTVMADEEAALTIAQNLISNAIRHTEPGGHVEITCRPEDAGWVMAVRDDGVGIAEEFQERIFERFYRVEKNRKSADGGTGIGLAIVKNLTRSMDGTVKVISSPGEGATFQVWLPRSQ